MKSNFSRVSALAIAMIVAQSLATSAPAVAGGPWYIENKFTRCALVPVGAALLAYQFCVRQVQDVVNPVGKKRDFKDAQAECAKMGGRLPTAYELVQIGNPKGVVTQAGYMVDEIAFTAIDKYDGSDKGAKTFLYSADGYKSPEGSVSYDDVNSVVVWSSTPSIGFSAGNLAFDVHSGRFFSREADEKNNVLCVPVEGLKL